MSINGPIIIVEDDRDDEDVIKACLAESGFNNEIRWMRNGREALDYLRITSENPFIILCDMLMPMLNGLELLKTINADPVLHKKAIPFVFMTRVDSEDLVAEAFNLFAQGFFIKGDNYQALKAQIACILTYWKHSRHPRS